MQTVKKNKNIFDLILGTGAVTWLLFVLLWWFMSLFQEDILLPGPLKALQGSVEIITNGKLFLFAGISFRRVFVGWSLGCLFGIPFGVLIGRVRGQKDIRAVSEFFQICSGTCTYHVVSALVRSRRRSQDSDNFLRHDVYRSSECYRRYPVYGSEPYICGGDPWC